MLTKLAWDSVTDVGDHFASCVWQASAKFLELGGLAPGKIVIDLACGTGSLARQAAERVQGNGGRVIGIDASARMVEAAREQAAGAGNLEFLVHDASVLPLPDDSCDVIFCRFALPLLADPPLALARSLAVLSPGGRFAVMGIGGASHNEFFTLLHDVVGEPLQQSLMYGETQKLATLLEDAGFEGVKARSIRALITVEDPQSYWSCVRGVFGIAQPQMPPEIAQRVRPGLRLALELVFALGTKHDPNARAMQRVRSMDDMVAAARRSIRELSPYEVKRKLKGEQVVILDVREPDARETRLKNAVNIPRGELEKHVVEVVKDPRALILTYCDTGRQGALAARQLQDLGYENVWNLYGGITAWLADGMPVERK
jgi:ubiquinone/menaquinone biosynthesis C-methylase UbiE/rhodanese-related sulfurtransferase